MNAAEIVQNFTKGHDKCSISGKQRDWLISQTKKESLVVKFDGFNDLIYFPNCYYKINSSSRLASGGSYVARQTVPGRYNLKKIFSCEV